MTCPFLLFQLIFLSTQNNYVRFGAYVWVYQEFQNVIFFVSQDYEPFLSYEGLEQLHRFIFVMAVTHISYSCLTMLLAVVKVNLFFCNNHLTNVFILGYPYFLIPKPFTQCLLREFGSRGL